MSPADRLRAEAAEVVAQARARFAEDEARAARLLAVANDLDGNVLRSAVTTARPYWTLREAAITAGKDEKTIRRWCRVDATLGGVVGGQWRISKARLAEVLSPSCPELSSFVTSQNEPIGAKD